ncbi:MAG: 50S ribosomal protein L11 methyltransferase [Anaerolineales bacterium]
MQTSIVILAILIIVISLIWLLVPAIYGLPSISAHPDRIRKALKLANLQPNENFYDLGSGHGQVMIMAAKEFGANATGIEAGPVQCVIAWINATRNGVSSKVHIEAGNFFKSNIDQADVVYAYLTSQYAFRLQEKLEKELRPGTRVVTIAFELPGWQPIAFDRENLIYLYVK